MYLIICFMKSYKFIFAFIFHLLINKLTYKCLNELAYKPNP